MAERQVAFNGVLEAGEAKGGKSGGWTRPGNPRAFVFRRDQGRGLALAPPRPNETRMQRASRLADKLRAKEFPMGGEGTRSQDATRTGTKQVLQLGRVFVFLGVPSLLWGCRFPERA